jgi:hypothetical protein
MRSIDEYPEVNPFNDVTAGRVIGWWSGGVASAVACLLALERWGEDVVLVFCDTSLEHPDTYRFMADYERVVGVKIQCIKSDRMSEPEEVWYRYKGLNFARGAPCSMVLKKEPRLKFQDLKNDFCQVFGFDYCKKEMKRATNMLVNNPDLNPVFPLIVEQYDRSAIFAKMDELKIRPPKSYRHFLNNNCIGADDSPKGGCIQGGIGYWQKIKQLYPKKYDYMANVEHELSSLKGEPVTICKDQRNGKNGNRLFLKPSSDFPDVESIDVIKGRIPMTPFECNGFCSTLDFKD